jgi:hypothetical protein
MGDCSEALGLSNEGGYDKSVAYHVERYTGRVKPWE